MASFDLTNHVAIVTGANHGIGAATARVLADNGARVLVTYLRFLQVDDPGTREAYRRNRASDAEHVIAHIRENGGVAIAVEADLADPQTPRRLFETAEAKLGPVDILVNNASGWIADTFTTETQDRHRRVLRQISAETFDRQFSVDARGTATMIAEFARRHIGRDAAWGRIISLTSGGPSGFPGEVSYGAAKAALENYTMSAAFELAHLGITANTISLTWSIQSQATDSTVHGNPIEEVRRNRKTHRRTSSNTRIIFWMTSQGLHSAPSRPSTRQLSRLLDRQVIA